jgi:hypothetical protein
MTKEFPNNLSTNETVDVSASCVLRYSSFELLG